LPLLQNKLARLSESNFVHRLRDENIVLKVAAGSSSGKKKTNNDRYRVALDVARDLLHRMRAEARKAGDSHNRGSARLKFYDLQMHNILTLNNSSVPPKPIGHNDQHDPS